MVGVWPLSTNAGQKSIMTHAVQIALKIGGFQIQAHETQPPFQTCKLNSNLFFDSFIPFYPSCLDIDAGL